MKQLSLFLLILWSSCQSIDWKEGPGYRFRPLKINTSNVSSGFEELGPDVTGINFSNQVTEQDLLENRHYMHGSGVSIGDVNNDGWDDIYLCKMNGPNALYLNQGQWQFKEVAEQWGVQCPGQYSTGCTITDLNGDGNLDLVVTSMGGPVTLFYNSGTGYFEKEVFYAGYGATTSALADIDLDGDLDLYITHYKKKSLKDSLPPDQIGFDQIIQETQNGDFAIHPDFRDHYIWERRGDIVLQLELGESDRFFLNDGTGRFAPTSVFLNSNTKTIPKLPKDWGLVAQFRDINQDGWPDLYVCNDYESPDYLFLNRKGQLIEADNFTIRHTSNSSMSIDFSDLNQDGIFDFFVSDMLSQSHTLRKTQMGTMAPTPLKIGVYDDRPQYMRNTLFLSRTDHTYTELAQYAGVQASEWSWNTQFMDVDLDGQEDLLITTGHLYDVQDSDANAEEKRRFNNTQSFEEYRSLLFNYPRLNLQNIAFKNTGKGHFESIPDGWGLGKNADVSHGMAIGDLDGDGDLDAIINRMNQTVGVFKNEASNPRIAIRLIGQSPNTQAIGAKIILTQGGHTQLREIIAGGKYLSSNGMVQSFGVNTKDPIQLEIIWPNRTVSGMEGLTANNLYEIDQKNIPNSPYTYPTQEEDSFFKLDILDITHHESSFDDFTLQSLLPNRLSQFGPGLSYAASSESSFPSIWMPSGKGGRLQQLEYRSDEIVQSVSLKADLEQNCVLNIHDYRGDPTRLVLLNGYESQRNSQLLIIKNNRSERIDLPLPMVSMMSSADIDGDNDLDLFIGGRGIPGQYPQPASSLILIQEQGHWKIDSKLSEPFQDIGMVTSSCFSDMDQDQDPDLLLALEWGPIRIMQNTQGQFLDVTSKFGLEEYTGWWNSISTADINNDGRLDLLAGNWGENTKYHLDSTHPLQVFWGDFDNNEVTDIVEAHFDDDFNSLVPERGFSCMSNAMPFIRQEKRTYANYARSDLSEILGTRLEEANRLQANTLKSGIFINQGDHFSFEPLPADVQYTTAMHIGALDYNLDGHTDLIIGQNFFAVQVETDRNDGGRGLLLQGDGNGHYDVIPGYTSGIKIYGEQRGVAIGDLNQDHRPDIVIAQNAAPVCVLLNDGDKSGTTIYLSYQPENPVGIGAQLRWVYSSGAKGPVHELKAGHGRWSQDSPFPILGYTENPSHLEVIWPNGMVNLYDFEGQDQFNIRYESSEI